MPWWFADSEEAERWSGPHATHEEAEQVGRCERFEEGDPFIVAEAAQQPWRYDCFDRLDEAFDGVNEELGDGDGDPPSIDAGISGHRTGVPQELQDRLSATLRQWVEERGRPTAWALHFTAYHSVPATQEWHQREQGIE